MPIPARMDLHRGGVAGVEDLLLAMVGQQLTRAWPGQDQVPRLRDDRPFLTRIGYWSPGQRQGFLAQNLELLEQLALGSASWPSPP